VFWACGVTAIEGMRSAALPLAITHSPGYEPLHFRNETLRRTIHGIREALTVRH